MGMTQVYDQDGRRTAVTVIEAGPCVVVQRKTGGKDGYDAAQLGFGERSARRTPKAQAARFGKVDATPKACLREFGVAPDEEAKEGDAVTVSIFEGVSHVDVTGTSKGRGFQGVVKRYRMSGGRMTHGGHSRRRVGAIGQCAYPGRVAKGQRMPGHMGNTRVTVQNLEVMGLRSEDNLILVRGAVPGPTGAFVFVRRALKKAGQAE